MSIRVVVVVGGGASRVNIGSRRLVTFITFMYENVRQKVSSALPL